VAGFCERGNEPSGSKKEVEFYDWTSDYRVLKKDSAPYRCIVKKTRTFLLFI
jgi:hypothetical protein